MSKTAWLVTHDNNIDRRIFFFADVLKSNGFTIKLFASHYFDLLSDRDPSYVERPVDIITVARFQMNMSQILPSVAELFQKIIAAQARWFEQNKAYASSLKVLGIYCMPNTKLSISVHETMYLVSVRTKDYKIIYNSMTGMLQVVEKLALEEESQLYQQAIYQYITRCADFHDTTFSVGNINICTDVDVYGGVWYYAQNPAMNFYYRFSPSEQVIEKIQPIPFGNYNEDVLDKHKFNFVQYKKIVYDYSPIMVRINRELMTETPDLVYVADLPTLPIGTMLKQATGCHLMVDCHEWWFKQARLWETDFTEKITLSERYEAELYPQCDLCITVGEFLASDMEKCYGRKFETIYSCMSSALTVKPQDFYEEIWEKEFQIPHGSRIVVFQGSMTTLRNLDNLARATKYLSKDSYLVVVGGGPYEPEFKKILHKEGNPEQVRFAGWVKQADLMRYTVNAHLGVLPYSAVDEYFSYSVPNKLMEYFEATMPMLYDSSMKEIAMVAGENQVGVGVDLSNPKVFGEKMDELLHDVALLQLLKGNYAPCKDKFRFESQGQHFEEMLSNYFPDLMTKSAQVVPTEGAANN